MAGMVNQMINLQPAANPNVKDSRWLTLEVCREFQRSKCTRTENECKFAHPPPHVEVQNGRVIACFDSIKGKCQRKDPPCKYLHPPQHLREQLLQNGRNNLILRNLQLQAAQAALQPFVPGMIPVAGNKIMAYPAVIPSGQYPIVAPPYMGSIPTSAIPSYNPYLNSMPTISMPGSESSGLVAQQQVPGVIPTTVPAQTQKIARPDRLEESSFGHQVCREFQRGTCTRQPNDCRFAHPPDNVTVENTDNNVTVCMDFIKGKCSRDSCRYFHPPSHLQAQIKAAQQRVANAPVATAPSALPQVVEVLTAGKKRPRDPTDDLVLGALPTMVPPYKRMAMTDSKSGIPMTYQPSAINAYQHAALMQLGQQQQYIPVTYSLVVAPTEPTLVAASPVPALPIPSNAANVDYFDNNKQLRDTLQVCRDFKSGKCDRPQCKFVHILEDYVEVMDGHVTVCRDSVRGKCQRPLCKYFHIPVVLPPST